jgi:uncharacterized protein (TIGR03032 family)
LTDNTDNRTESIWRHHNLEWRDPAQVAAMWPEAGNVEPGSLEHRATGGWWETLERIGVTLLVTREHEHLVLSLRVSSGSPKVSYMRIPHPSGVAVHRESHSVFIASTRNPNQIFVFQKVKNLLPRSDLKGSASARRHVGKTLVPVGTLFLPGSLYIHDLAEVGGRVYAAACGHNAVVLIGEHGGYSYEWWPRCVEKKGKPDFQRNYIQLNSIAAGGNLASSFFSASADEVTSRKPGQLNYPVDGRGVIFSGESREAMCRGLTRPHSARLHNGKVWVNNSGYGELGFAGPGERFVVVSQLPGWTRGLCIVRGVAFVGTSRIIPRFRAYAPGLDVDSSICGIHAVDIRTGSVLGSLLWPSGNQIFSVECLTGVDAGAGFPFAAGKTCGKNHNINLFYAFDLGGKKEK